MRYEFCPTIRDDALDVDLICDLEVEVDAEFDMTDGLIINAVYLNGKSLMAGGMMARVMAAEIMSQAEDSEALLEKVMDGESIEYRGKGGSDPDGHYVRRRF